MVADSVEESRKMTAYDVVHFTSFKRLKTLEKENAELKSKIARLEAVAAGLGGAEEDDS